VHTSYEDPVQGGLQCDYGDIPVFNPFASAAATSPFGFASPLARRDDAVEAAADWVQKRSSPRGRPVNSLRRSAGGLRGDYGALDGDYGDYGDTGLFAKKPPNTGGLR